MARRRWLVLEVFLLAGLLAGCRSAEVKNHCLELDGDCPPCATRADCGFTGNNCTEVVVCVHRDVPLAHVDIGCSEELEYSWPDPEECACVGSVCQYSNDYERHR